MKKRILELEKKSRLLEPDGKARKKARKQVIDYTENFLEQIGKKKAFISTDENGHGLLSSPIEDKPLSMGGALGLLKKHVDTPGLNPASGGHLGYIPGGGIYFSALGDYMADILNRYAGFYFASPGAVRMEHMLCKWVADQIGYPQGAAGNLCSGGSLANLSAIVTAREAKSIKAKNIEKGVIYLTVHAHHCIQKAIRIAGLGESIIRFVPVDHQYRMNRVVLENLIRDDLKKGLKPWLVIASAGTTDTGAIDPLQEISRVAHKYNLWFHIDAAYGGFFVLTKNGRKKLKGLELSDSIVLDPHKGMFLPYGLGLVLVKKKEHLLRAHHYQANYLQDSDPESEVEHSPADLSAELTKHFRGLRFWLPLKLHGVKPFRDCLDEKLLLASYFHKQIKKAGFETGPEPELSVVTYRYIPKNRKKLTEDAINSFNEKLIKAVQKDGRIFISSTLLHNRFTLRFACLSFRTHLSTVDLLVDILKKNAKSLERKL
ncbi:MAG: pyridoxal phosphate-dependent decarboxylase family protein [Bacteroidia bacterium]